MNRIGKSLAAAVAIISLAACATSGQISQRQQREAMDLARHVAAAGAPVRSVTIIGSPSWDRIDADHLVYRLMPNRQYLLQLDGPCLDQNSGPMIGISSDMGRITSGFDRVMVRSGVGSFGCRIVDIRPLDVGKLRAGEVAAKT